MLTDQYNATLPIGIYFNKQYQQYHVRIYRGGKNHHIGRFSSLDDAVSALEVARKNFDFPRRLVALTA